MSTQAPPKQSKMRPVLSQAASRRLVLIVTIVCVANFIALLWLGAYSPQRFHSAVAKFFVCVLLAFCLAIVMFVIYPQEARLKNVPLINLPVELVGPPALFVISLALLWYIYPGPPGRLFFIRPADKPVVFQLETFEIRPASGGCVYYAVRDSGNKYNVGGIYAEFKGENGRCEAEIGNTFVTYVATFDLGAKSDAVGLRAPERK